MFRLRPFLFVVALALIPAAIEAEDPPEAVTSRLTVETITDGRWPYTGSGAPSITWIPGADAWLEWQKDDHPAPRPAAGIERLVRVDAVTGVATTIVGSRNLDAALTGLASLIEPVRGIGRRGPARLTVAPDGAAVVVLHRGALVRVDLSGNDPPLRLNDRGPVSDVRVAAGGRRISYVRDHDLFAAIIERGGETGGERGGERGVERGGTPRVGEIQLTHDGTETHRHGELDWVYPEEFECTTATWWSPDSSRVAVLGLDESKVPRFPIVDPTPNHGSTTNQFYPYVGDPNPMASIDVIALDGGSTTSLDLGLPPAREPYAPWVAWTPDGARAVVAVLDRRQTRFELRACELKTGAGTPVWRERSDSWVDLPPPPRVLATRNVFLLKSRRDGHWRHWWVPLDGASPPRPLSTPGVDAGDLLAVDEEKGVFFHAQRTPDGLHDVVRRVPFEGGTGTTLLDDGSSHATSFSTTGRVFLDSASTVTSPPRVVVRSADGKKIRELADTSTPEFRALALVPPTFLTLPADDGTPCFAALWKPRDFDATKRYPLLVYGYGGPSSRMVADTWQGGNALVRVLLDAGFLVLTVDGRGTGGHGKAFEAGIGRHLGEIEAADQASAVRELARDPWVDRARVGVWGGSYGGFLALTCVANHPDVFRAAVAIAPVTDWRLYDSIYTERYMGTPEENAEGYERTSIVARAKDLRGAVLVLHGLSDDNVHAQNTLRLVDACLAAGVPLEWNIYPRRGHGIDGAGARADVYRRILSHFERSLISKGANGR